ncbi:Anoctamin-10 [Holothuria leucospilota]|uniref:Anoctamin n=1 Tax=Holothuria leucospilota TaxID=206669 RepID=A0A9Q1HDG2_HOLLE|nr:Anoctamin-10 [Holothuria leucospilota]
MYLGTLLVVQQFIEQFLETALPYLVLRFWRGHKELNGDSAATKKTDEENANNSHSEESIRNMVKAQGQMDIYPGTFDDYLELFLQFGYVFLFSAVYPLAAAFALLNNVIEVKSDAFKLTKVCRRPFGQAVADIGTWQVEYVEHCGNNTAVAYVASGWTGWTMSRDPEGRGCPNQLRDGRWKVSSHNLYLPMEISRFFAKWAWDPSLHVFLAIKAAIAILIPDLPDWMEEELAKEEYQSKLALNRKKAEELERSLSEEGKKDL